MNDTHKTPMSKPRLEITVLCENGVEKHLGSFADGPRGRKDAAAAFKRALEQDLFLERSGGRDKKGFLIQSVAIERVFADGQSQRLERMPRNDEGAFDEYPQTMRDAQLLEANRARAFLDYAYDRTVPGSPPLTPLESRAKSAWERHDADEKMTVLSRLAKTVLAIEANDLNEKLEANTAQASARYATDDDTFNPNGNGEHLAPASSGDEEPRPRSRMMRL